MINLFASIGGGVGEFNELTRQKRALKYEKELLAANEISDLNLFKKKEGIKSNLATEKLIAENRINFGNLNFEVEGGEVTPVPIFYTRDYTSEDNQKSYSNMLQINNLLNNTKFTLEDGGEEISLGQFLANDYMTEKGSRKYADITNAIMDEFKLQDINFQKTYRPTPTEGQEVVLNVESIFGEGQMSPLLRLIHNSNTAELSGKTLVNGSVAENLPSVNKMNVVEKEGQLSAELGESVNAKELDIFVSRFSTNKGVSPDEFKQEYLYTPDSNNAILVADNSKIRIFQAAANLSNIPGLKSKNPTKTVLRDNAAMFLNKEDENFYVGGEADGLFHIQEAIALNLDGDKGSKKQGGSPYYSVITKPDIKGTLELYGYKEPRDVDNAYNSTNNVVIRVTNLERALDESIQQKGGVALGIFAAADVTIAGISDIPSQVRAIANSKKVKAYIDNFTGSGERLDFSSEEYFDGIQNDALEGQKEYRNFVSQYVDNGVFENVEDVKAKYKLYKDGVLSEGKQKDALESLDKSYSAIIRYHSYLLAFEMAAAVQGGGDSRTISDRDVKIMQNVIFSRFMSGKDFRAVLNEIKTTMVAYRDYHGLFQNGKNKNSVDMINAAAMMVGRGGLVDINVADGYDPQKIYQNTIASFKSKNNKENIKEIDVSNQNYGTRKVEKTDLKTEKLPTGLLNRIKSMEIDFRNENNTINDANFTYITGALKAIEANDSFNINTFLNEFSPAFKAELEKRIGDGQ